MIRLLLQLLFFLSNCIALAQNCGEPIPIMISNISNNSVSITLSEPSEFNTTTGYTYAHSTVNTLPDELIFTESPQFDLTGLEPNTTYYVFARCVCGGVNGEWVQVSFTTASCAPAVVPYNENFEDVVLSTLPECSYLYEGSTSPLVESEPAVGFTSNTLSFSHTISGAFLYLRGIYLEAGKYYRINYKYGSDIINDTAGLDVWLFDNMEPNLNFTLMLGGHTDMLGVHSNSQNFAVSESGIYYIALSVYSVFNNEKLYFDDLMVKEVLCGEPTELSSISVTDQTATFSWEQPTWGAAEPEYNYEVTYSTTNNVPLSGTTISETSITVDNLQASTDYYFFIRTLCSNSEWSDWTSTPFTTNEELNTGNLSFASGNIYPNPVKDVLNISNTENIDKVDIYNVTGQLVRSENGNSQNEKINLSKLSSGIYLLSVSTEHGVSTYKIIKE